MESPCEIGYKGSQNFIFFYVWVELVSICSVDLDFFGPWIREDIAYFI
jgi:hypothetical protein